MATTTSTNAAAISPELYRAAAAFHEQAARAFTLYGFAKHARAARGIAYICRDRAARLEAIRGAMECAA